MWMTLAALALAGTPEPSSEPRSDPALAAPVEFSALTGGVCQAFEADGKIMSYEERDWCYRAFKGTWSLNEGKLSLSGTRSYGCNSSPGPDEEMKSQILLKNPQAWRGTGNPRNGYVTGLQSGGDCDGCTRIIVCQSTVFANNEVEGPSGDIWLGLFEDYPQSWIQVRDAGGGSARVLDIARKVGGLDLGPVLDGGKARADRAGIEILYRSPKEQAGAEKIASLLGAGVTTRMWTESSHPLVVAVGTP